MKSKTYLYDFNGYFSYNNVENQYFDKLDEVRTAFPNEYAELRNAFINEIISFIKLCGCKYVTIGRLAAHKRDIRHIFKGDTSTANLIISIIFSFKEEQRINIKSVSTLLRYAMDDLIGVMLDNRKRHLTITCNKEFWVTFELPFQPPSKTWSYEYGQLRLDCEISEISNYDEN